MTNKRKLITYNINGPALQKVESAKYLGVHIHPKCNLDYKHIHSIKE